MKLFTYMYSMRKHAQSCFYRQIKRFREIYFSFTLFITFLKSVKHFTLSITFFVLAFSPSLKSLAHQDFHMALSKHSSIA